MTIENRYRPYVEHLSKHYDLNEFTNLRLLEGGSTNTNIAFDSNYTSYIFVICNDKSTKQIEPFLEMMLLLEKNGFPTSYIIPTLDNSSYVVINSKVVYIRTFIPGSLFNQKTVHREQIKNLAATIFQLHSIDPVGVLPEQHNYGMDSWSQIYDKQHQFIRWLKEIQNQLQRRFIEIGDLPFGLVHADLFDDNIIWNGKQHFILDFEELGKLPFVMDIGMLIVGSFSANQDINYKLAASFLHEYQKNRKLTQNEKEAIYDYTIFAAACTAFWRFRQYRVLVPDESKQNRYSEMQSLADGILRLGRKEFGDRLLLR